MGRTQKDVISSERQLTAAFDFDGVIAEYDGWKGIGVLGKPIRSVTLAMATLHDAGWKIILNTTRGVNEVESYLKAHEIPYDEINRNSSIDSYGGKPIADVYIDDRAVCYHGQTAGDLIDDIHALVHRKKRA